MSDLSDLARAFAERWEKCPSVCSPRFRKSVETRRRKIALEFTALLAAERQAGRIEGAREMRERAAQQAPPGDPIQNMIRSLPLSGEEPSKMSDQPNPTRDQLLATAVRQAVADVNRAVAAASAVGLQAELDIVRTHSYGEPHEMPILIVKAVSRNVE